MGRKILTTVDFNVNELDLSSVVKSCRPRYSRFELYAVSNHYGTMDAGHYTAYCKNPEYNKWFKFDDQNVVEINGNEVRSSAAYILFYRGVDYRLGDWSILFIFYDFSTSSAASNWLTLLFDEMIKNFDSINWFVFVFDFDFVYL